MARRDSSRRRLTGWLTPPRAAALLLGVLGVLVGVGGYIYHHCECQSWPNLVTGWEQEFEGFYANVSSSLVTITIVVLTIDWLNERRVEQQLKAQLIREMGSTDNGIALRAVRELRARGWHRDGTLCVADLAGANLRGGFLGAVDLRAARLYATNLRDARLGFAKLQGTFLRNADLRGAHLEGVQLQEAELPDADLRGANLTNANLRGVLDLSDEQLVTLSALRGSMMPDGK